MTTSKVTTALSLSVLALSISASVNAAPSFTPGLHNSAAQLNSENPLPKRYIVKFKTADAAAGFSMATNAIDDAEYQPRAN